MVQDFRGGLFMNVILKIYEFKETQEKECPNSEEANRIVKEMIEDNPNLLIETYVDMELDVDCEIDLSDAEDYETATRGAKAIAV
jgi:hypothetical protein